MKTYKTYESKYQAKQKKTKSQSRIFDNRENWSGENGGQSSLFSDGLLKLNFTRDYQSNKLFKLRSNKLMRYPPRINDEYSGNTSIKNNNQGLSRGQLNTQTHLDWLKWTKLNQSKQ